MPVPGRVDEGQFTYYTVTPSQSGNITVKLQMTDGMFYSVRVCARGACRRVHGFEVVGQAMRLLWATWDRMPLLGTTSGALRFVLPVLAGLQGVWPHSYGCVAAPVPSQCDSSSATTCSFEALYIRAGQTVYVSVWGRMGKNVGDDDQDKAVDRYYLSVSN